MTAGHLAPLHFRWNGTNPCDSWIRVLARILGMNYSAWPRPIRCATRTAWTAVRMPHTRQPRPKSAAAHLRLK